MGLFGPSRQEKALNKMIKNGNPNAYKSRKHCGICRHFNSGTGYCRLQNGKTTQANICNNWQSN